jgi:hypothetical protein
MANLRTWAWVTTDVDEFAIGSILEAAARLTNESDVYATPACRATIVGQSGKQISPPWPTSLPMTLDLADKVAKYMGSPTGRWNSKHAFDESPANQVTNFAQVTNTYQSTNQGQQWWGASITWARYFDTVKLFYPGYQTVYTTDTSVLNDLITVMACTQLEKIAHRVWTQMVGNGRYSPSQFAEKSDELLTKAVTGLFDGRFKIIPKTYFTVNDTKAGYSWHCKISIYGTIMPTVGNYTINALRSSDLPQPPGA